MEKQEKNTESIKKDKPKGNQLFKPGVSGNPKGRPKMSEEERKLKSLSRDSFNLIVRKYLGLSVVELKEASKRQEITALEMMVISVMSKAMQKGDEKKLNWFLEQLFGKMVSKFDLTSGGDVIAPPQTVNFIIPSNGRDNKEEQ